MKKKGSLYKIVFLLFVQSLFFVVEGSQQNQYQLASSALIATDSLNRSLYFIKQGVFQDSYGIYRYGYLSYDPNGQSPVCNVSWYYKGIIVLWDCNIALTSEFPISYEQTQPPIQTTPKRQIQQPTTLSSFTPGGGGAAQASTSPIQDRQKEVTSVSQVSTPRKQSNLAKAFLVNSQRSSSTATSAASITPRKSETLSNSLSLPSSSSRSPLQDGQADQSAASVTPRKDKDEASSSSLVLPSILTISPLQDQQAQIEGEDALENALISNTSFVRVPSVQQDLELMKVLTSQSDQSEVRDLSGSPVSPGRKSPRQKGTVLYASGKKSPISDQVSFTTAGVATPHSTRSSVATPQVFSPITTDEIIKDHSLLSPFAVRIKKNHIEQEHISREGLSQNNLVAKFDNGVEEYKYSNATGQIFTKSYFPKDIGMAQIIHWIIEGLQKNIENLQGGKDGSYVIIYKVENICIKIVVVKKNKDLIVVTSYPLSSNEAEFQKCNKFYECKDKTC